MKRFAAFLMLLPSLLIASSAYALVINFDFNTLADGKNNSKVQQYMNNVLNSQHPGGTVAVSGAMAEKNYTADGHVVGPVSGSTVTPLTLGDTDEGVQHALPWDTYLVNSGSDRITLLLSFPG